MSVKGKNSEIVHNGERYHIQTESWVPVENVLVTQIFKSGQVFLKKTFRPQKTGENFSESIVLEMHEKMIKELKDLLI